MKARKRMRIGKEETKKIGIGNGKRRLIVATMNVDDLRNKETREILAKRLEKMRIDIATIQETHLENNGEWGQGEYTFYITAARKNGAENKKNGHKEEKESGVAIAIKKDITENIVQIERINGRIMKMRLETNIHGKNNYSEHIRSTHVL